MMKKSNPITAFVLFVVIALWAALPFMAFSQPAPTIHAIDGDTINYNGERIRLLGIDAPELVGHCRRGRNCAPGDPIASRAALAALLLGGEITVTRQGTDLYGRTLALVAVNGQDLSCAQLRGGFAIYKRQWDSKPVKVRHICPNLAVS